MGKSLICAVYGQPAPKPPALHNHVGAYRWTAAVELRDDPEYMEFRTQRTRMGVDNPGPPETDLELFCKEAGYGSPPPVRRRLRQRSGDVLETRYQWWQERRLHPIRTLTRRAPTQDALSSSDPQGDAFFISARRGARRSKSAKMCRSFQRCSLS